MDINQKAVNNIRILSSELIQKANSGHPGASMGIAPMMYSIYSSMKHNPKHSHWHDRDRFVLSSGHASALLYVCLHMFGYNVSKEDLLEFRQFGSITPGHPEYGLTDGVETTTGPLGQGVANAVGMAIAETMLAARFNKPNYPVVDHYTYAICGDGCMMEGICSEASALAGTLNLNKLILLYDDNDISIEGNTDIAMKEDIAKRYEAYGWNVIKLEDANDYRNVLQAIEEAKKSDKPNLIICPTIIGYGCPSLQGSHEVHGAPLGEKALAEAKAFLEVNTEEFGIDEAVLKHIRNNMQANESLEEDWNNLMKAYSEEYPELYAEYQSFFSNDIDASIFDDPSLYDFNSKAATRNTSGEVLNKLAVRIKNLVGGSADLAPSNKTYIKNAGDYSAVNRLGRNMHFGVREHSMAAICNGIALHGGLRVYCGTFFIFSDYMKHAMRLSALMGLPVIYVLTHDSIGVGEDGATHEPIEQLAGFRAMPNINIFRPADGRESAWAWRLALQANKPSCLVLSRQNLPSYDNSGEGVAKGAYIISKENSKIDLILMASGSEVEYAMEAQKLLLEDGIDSRVVSFASMELFEAQSDEYKESVLPNSIRKRLAIEAASTLSWYKYVGLDGVVLGIDKFGASAPGSVLYKEYGMTTENVVKAARDLIK